MEVTSVNGIKDAFGIIQAAVHGLFEPSDRSDW